MFQMLVAGPITSSGQTRAAIPGTSNTGQYNEYNRKYTKLHEGLDSTISVEGKHRIERILNEVQLLTDVEKLLLYLKLPTGVPQDEYLRATPPSCLPASNRREQGEATTWIKSHLEEHGEVCMPKAEVYEEYKLYCTQHELRPLCNADFGKVMKTVFPDINTRRLGQRGQSKYFYGGLRKKLEHALPGLPELEIHSKTLEVDNSNGNTEVFNASCKLICEWADKLLDSKFNGVQEVAEHLVSSMYVNTKSVAAFTLIASMQETGNQFLKGSALFNSQASNTADKHKETNLLLQQKLQKNKVLQKQKEKLQAMKEENENQSAVVPSSLVDRKGPLSSKSSTPSRMARTPKLTSPFGGQSSPKASTPSNIPSTQHMITMATSTSDLMPAEISSQVKPDPISTSIHTHISIPQNTFDQPSNNDNVTILKGSGQDRIENVCDPSISEDISIKDSNEKPLNETDINGFVLSVKSSDLDSNRETPFTEMEVNSNARTHVRKISFDDVSETKTSEQKKQSDGGKTSKIEMLSKSAGHLSLKMLLERKAEDQSSLNKSTGLLEKSKNTLLVNQSNVAGRSAFVPFAQVQQPRRETGDGSQSATYNIPNLFEKSTNSTDSTCSEKESQFSKITRVPATCADQPRDLQATRGTDNRRVFSGTTAVNLPGVEKVPQAFPPSDSQTIQASTRNATMDSLTILTSSTLTTSSSSEIVTQTQNSPGMSKHLRTRFTPIRPKGSPNKAPSSKDTKSDNPVYDKRPVSEILKEKRAKEQAKFQVGINLPSIPTFQPNISLSNGNFSSFQQLPSVGGKEVVIIVNNQSGGDLRNLVKQASMFNQPTSDNLQPMYKNECRPPFASVGMKSGKEDTANVKPAAYTEIKDNHEVDNPDQYTDVQPASPSSEMEVDSYDLNLTHDPRKEDLNPPDSEQGQKDKFEQIYTETPAKIARLNITSPFRPDSACSLGRDTPFRVTKPQEPCSSRPDSACSYGRETPSGARKRKSSDYQQRRDFKRLNSTGDDCEEGVNERLLLELLSPSYDKQTSDSQRRTQSCTYELERDVRRGVPYSTKSHTTNLPEGLQSPDITSLEEEALIESFPNSLFVMRPHKSQRHSVGVGGRSVKMYQQRLLKQKQVLDKRVGSFLQQQKSSPDLMYAPLSNSGPTTHTDFKIPYTNQDVTQDSVGDVRNMAVMTSLLSGKGKKESEPSGLPPDVADWINETIEKRQTSNHSVLSEPELGVLNTQRCSTALDFTALPFHFEVDPDKVRTCRSGGLPEKRAVQGKDAVRNCDEDTFTIPKAPLLSLKVKDLPGRITDAQHPSQRCQSLPMFASTSKSPLSPVSLPINKHTAYQRAVSMSPKQESVTSQTNLLSPVSGLTSPLRRIEVRDNPPVFINAQTVTSAAPSKPREESFLRLTNYIGQCNGSPGEETRGQVGSYLASIQHNLQKPKDASQESEQPKIRESGFVAPSTKLTGSRFLITASQLPLTSQTSQTNVLDNSVKLAQFSDSGYQSSGPSPVLNVTPISVEQEADMNANGQTHTSLVSESPIYMTSSIHQSQHLAPNVQMSFQQTNTRLCFDGIVSQGIISSSKHSAFIPIQSSDQPLQFVTPKPIRPSVSQPNQIYQMSTRTGDVSNQSNLFKDPNHSLISPDVSLISPKGHDPPPYEAAVKSLRQSTLGLHGRGVKSVCLDPRLSGRGSEGEKGLQQHDAHKDTISPERGRVSLLATMGKEYDSRPQDRFGPFASKLVQLSRQTKTSSLNQDNAATVNTMVPVTQTPCSLSNNRLIDVTTLLGSNNTTENSVDIDSAIPDGMMEGLVGRNRTQPCDGDALQKGLQSDGVSIPQTIAGLEDLTRDGQTKDYTGARGTLPPNIEHTEFNMDIDFLHSPDSESLLHFSSAGIHPDRALYSSNPSFPASINSVHSTHISCPSSHSYPTASVSIPVSSTHPSCTSHPHQYTNRTGVITVVGDQSNIGAQRNVDPMLESTVDPADDLPVDLDLMLQDLKELESDLLQDDSRLKLGSESQTTPGETGSHIMHDEINYLFKN